MEDEAAITQTLQILNELDNASMIVNRSDDKIDLEINSEVIGIGDTKFKLKYRLILSKGDKRQV